MKLTDESKMPIGRKFKDVAMEDVPAYHLLWWKGVLEKKHEANRTYYESLVLEYILDNLEELDNESR